MNTNLVVTNLRASAFLPQIAFGKEIIDALKEELDGFIPSVFSLPNINGLMIEQQSNEWMMVTPNRKQKLVFHESKVDFIDESDLSYNIDVITQFSTRCKRIFQTIINTTGFDVSRIAIAPTLRIIKSREEIKTWINTLSNGQLFKEEQLDISDFSQIYRVKEKIAGQEFLMNYLAKFSTERTMVRLNDKNAIVEQYLLDLDINTFADSNYVFDNESVGDFYSQSTNFCQSFIEFYLN